MSQPPSPPYVLGAQTQPRELNRWLDVNPQNGPLTRTQTYITVPTFSVAINWKGYSEIVAAFNYEGPNNFSLQTNVVPLPTTSNYALAIMWRSNGITYRYWLIQNVGEVIYFPRTTYAGQQIKKNFRLEIWSINDSPAINGTAFNIYTSVLGNVDYRWGLDTDLINADLVATDFQNINIALLLPTDISQYFWWDVNTGMGIGGGNVLTSWTEKLHNFVLSPAGSVAALPAIGTIKPVTAVDLLVGGSLHGDLTTANQLLETIVLNIRLAAGFISGIILTDVAAGGGVGVGLNKLSYSSVGSGSFSIYNNNVLSSTVSGISTEVWYTIIISFGSLFVYETITGILVGSSTSSSTQAIAGLILFQGDNMSMLDITFGNQPPQTIADVQNIANFFTDKYFGSVLSLPLTFLANSVPANN